MVNSNWRYREEILAELGSLETEAACLDITFKDLQHQIWLANKKLNTVMQERAALANQQKVLRGQLELADEQE